MLDQATERPVPSQNRSRVFCDANGGWSSKTVSGRLESTQRECSETFREALSPQKIIRSLQLSLKQQAIPNGDKRQLGLIGGVEFLLDVVQVGADGARA
jgi:hypothetical protein